VARSIPSVALACALIVGGAACSGGDDGEPIIDVGESAVGTCLDVPEDMGPEVTELPVAPCDEPHTHEVFAVLLYEPPEDSDIAPDVYPGFEALEDYSRAACLAEFEGYVGVSAFDSALFYSWIVPTLTSWDQEDDREVICVIGNANGAPLVGSVQNSQR